MEMLTVIEPLVYAVPATRNLHIEATSIFHVPALVVLVTAVVLFVGVAFTVLKVVQSCDTWKVPVAENVPPIVTAKLAVFTGTLAVTQEPPVAQVLSAAVIEPVNQTFCA
jgi:hypothetical protein